MSNAKEILTKILSPDTPQKARILEFQRLRNLADGSIKSDNKEDCVFANLFLAQIYAGFHGHGELKTLTGIPRHDLAKKHYGSAFNLNPANPHIYSSLIAYYAIRLVTEFAIKSPRIDADIKNLISSYFPRSVPINDQKTDSLAQLNTVLLIKHQDKAENITAEERVYFWMALHHYYSKNPAELEKSGQCLKFAQEACLKDILLPHCLTLSSIQCNDKPNVITNGKNLLVNLIKFSNVFENKKPIELLKNTLEATNALSADKAALLWLNFASYFMYKNPPQYDEALQALQNARKNLPVEQKAILIDRYIELSVLSQNIFKETDVNYIKRGCINDVINITDPIELANQALSMNPATNEFALTYAEIAVRALHQKLFLAWNNSDKDKCKTATDLTKQLYQIYPKSNVIRTKYHDMTNKHYRRNDNAIHQQNQQQHDTSHSTPTNPANHRR